MRAYLECLIYYRCSRCREYYGVSMTLEEGIKFVERIEAREEVGSRTCRRGANCLYCGYTNRADDVETLNIPSEIAGKARQHVY